MYLFLMTRLVKKWSIGFTLFFTLIDLELKTYYFKE